jgi:hypothetical protein
MGLMLEVFFVTFASEEAVDYARRSVQLRDGIDNPDDVLAAQIERVAAAGQIICSSTPIVHSTSWRWDPSGRVVLTYLVFAEGMRLAVGDARTLAFDCLVLAHSNDPTRPRPPVIDEHHVLSHGLRHFSYLIAHQGHPTYGALVSASARRRFARLAPVLAGNPGLPCPLPKLDAMGTLEGGGPGPMTDAQRPS